MLKMLKTGDPCPCCGEPIKTKDPDTLLDDEYDFVLIDCPAAFNAVGAAEGG